MREVRHITVAVSPELYRQTRRIAADYDTTVTAIVADLLHKLPRLVKYTPYGSGSTPTPSPIPQTSAKREEDQKSAATPSPSETSSPSPAPLTAPACQYYLPTSTS
jgi:hypothetical protein